MSADKYLNTFSAIVIMLSIVCCGESKEKSESSPQKESKQQEKFTPPAETEPVLGSWIRPDGGYNLHIMAFNKNTVDAAYYNPNPIMVSETQWKIQDGYVYLFVKFDDVGYEGSYYSLGYYPDKDILMGFYYQAAMNQKFDIYFEREKEQ
jgi:hypothetical protein